MTDAQAALAQVREALEAYPSQGEWYANGTVVYLIHSGQFDLCDCLQPYANAAYIAKCNPENIAAIIAHVEAQAAEIERLRAGLRAVSDLIDESHGVAGLHRNGAVAPWGDLRTGGRYEEWLASFDDALKEQR